MKSVLFLLLFFPFIAFAQTQQNEAPKENKQDYLYMSGLHLTRFTSTMATGIALSVLGTAAFVGGTMVNLRDDGADATPIIMLGGALSFAGFMTTCMSYAHVRIAGKYLMNKHTSIDLKPGGVSLALRF